MKTKNTLQKKLVLTRKTIANLDSAELGKVHGGAWEKTVDATACVTNCTVCPTQRFC